MLLLEQPTGIPANLLSLGAIDFGIIVDGNLVMVQHILRRLAEQGRDSQRRSVDDTSRRAAIEMQRRVFFSLVIIIAAYIPLFTLERVERRLFTPMAYTVCFALLGALILALTLVPVLATWVFRRGARTWRNPALEWLFDRYEHAVRWTLGRARRVVVAGTVLVVGGLAVGLAVGSEFLPQLDEGVIWIRSNLPPGISLEESADTAARIRALIRQSPEVKMVMSQSGRNDSGMDPLGRTATSFSSSRIRTRPGHRPRPSASSSGSSPTASMRTFRAAGSTSPSRSSTQRPRLPPAHRPIWHSLSADRTCPYCGGWPPTCWTWSEAFAAPPTRRSSRRPTSRSCARPSIGPCWRAMD
jgi:Cu/Ag efflux pump CusA